jgi:hypothetical protein
MQRSGRACGEVLIWDRDYYDCPAGGKAMVLVRVLHVHVHARGWVLLPRMVPGQQAVHQSPKAPSPLLWGCSAATHVDAGHLTGRAV